MTNEEKTKVARMMSDAAIGRYLAEYNKKYEKYFDEHGPFKAGILAINESLPELVNGLTEALIEHLD